MSYYLVSSRGSEFKKIRSFLNYSLSNNYLESSFKLDTREIEKFENEYKSFYAF